MNALRFARLVAAVILLLAGTAGLLGAQGNPLELGTAVAGFSVGLYFDLTATLLTAFVGALGWVVTTYTLNNLSNQGRVTRLGAALSVALLALTLLVAGASLPVIAFGWTVSGLAASWLVAHPDNPNARRAAAGMRRSLALSDLAVWSVVAVAAVRLPSLDRADLVASAATLDQASGILVAGLLVVSYASRSALPPVHRWLLETTESASPVSAFLHAGIVNGGGILLLLLWPLLAEQRPALAALVLLGAVALVIGTWSIHARDDTKGRLACSTTAQLGFVAIQLGLAVPAAALLHVIGHGAWKSWLFLRAGGAIERFRPAADAPATGRSVVGSLPLVVGAALGAPAAAALVSFSGPAGLAPVGLAALFALVGGGRLATIDRAATFARTAAGIAIGALTAGSLWILVAWKMVVADGYPIQGPHWPDLAAWAWLAVITVAMGLAWAGAAHLQRHRTGRLAVALLPAAVSPGLGGLRAARWPRVSTPQDSPEKRPLDPADVTLALRVASRVAGTAWPLSASVAVNPLAPLESLPFHEAVGVARRTHGAELMPQLDWFLERWADGTIGSAALLEALREAPGPTPTLTDFVRSSATLRDSSSDAGAAGSAGGVPRLCEALPGTASGRAGKRIDQEAGWWCQRAWATSHTQGPGPWQRWHTAAGRRGYALSSGLVGVTRLTGALPADPIAAITVLSKAAALPGSALVGYLVRQLATAPGWAAHAQWRRERGEMEALAELVALRMALDLLHTGAAGGSGLDLSPAPDNAAAEESDAHRLVWQRALELGGQQALLPALVDAASTAAPVRKALPQTQSLWCIDVRSERVRRHLEGLGRHETFGVAGFFGVASRHQDAEGRLTDQCPVLLEPSTTSRTRANNLTTFQLVHRATTAATAAPVVPLLTAEAYGVLAAAVSAISSRWPGLSHRIRSPWVHGSDQAAPASWDADLDTQVATVEGTLRAVGLVADFAPLLVVVGHGATTENNAHHATYQCGACGANSGSINARLFVAALNDPAVRRGLRSRGIAVPASTVAVAAVHDTTADLVTLADGDVPETLHATVLAQTRAVLAEAGRRTAHERLPSLPRSGTRGSSAARAVRRSHDWSEPTPEWGLAGNQAIIVAPRRMTAGLNLGGRVFLQSYEEDLDPQHHVLDQLMTAPVVVSQWISAQYQFSTTAPTVFGAGDKTTLNVVGDVGALTGAHGDLRLGLPWQSLFSQAPNSPGSTAPSSGAHSPVRHLVIVVADKNAVLASIRNHDGLRQLAMNRWVTFVAIDQGAHELGSDLEWRTVAPVVRARVLVELGREIG